MSDSYLGDNLIFIISQPRSGSTLLQRMLSGHADIKSSAETWLMLHPLYATRDQGITTEYGAKWAALAFNDFLEHYTDGQPVYDEAVRDWAKTFYENALAHSNGKIFIDKTPRYAMIISELLRLFPKARFIFLLRNPMAVLASEMDSFVKDDFNTLSVFQSDLMEAPHQIAAGIAQLGKKAIVIRYEQLVSNPENQMRALCAELGIDYCDAMLDYGSTPEAKGFMTDRVGIQQRTRPVTGSVGKWKLMVDDPQLLHFAQQYLQELGPELLNALGYPFEDILAVVGEGERNPKGLYPWRLAINCQDFFSMRDRYAQCRYRRRVTKGRLLGPVFALYDLWCETCRRFGRAIATLP